MRFSNPQIFSESSSGYGFSILHHLSSPLLNNLKFGNARGHLTSIAPVDSGTVNVAYHQLLTGSCEMFYEFQEPKIFPPNEQLPMGTKPYTEVQSHFRGNESFLFSSSGVSVRTR